MSATRLKLNPTKTEVLWLGSCQQLSQISISVISLQLTTIRVVESARDLVVTDSKLSLSAHVAALCRSGFYHLRLLRPVLRSLTHEAARTLVQAFISCRLDYCNSLLYTACLTATSGKFSLSRMPPLDFLLELYGGNTSRQCCASCTGFQSGVELTSNWHLLVSVWSCTFVLV